MEGRGGHRAARGDGSRQEGALEAVIEWIVALPAPAIWAVMLVASGVEYAFPPFPGDAVVLGGGILVGNRGEWPAVVPVFAAVTAGSVVGAWLDYELGRWLLRGGTTRLHRWLERPRVKRTVRRIQVLFASRGDFFIILNRFLPGLRALLFVTAGLSGLRRPRTLVLATLAAMLWNGLVLGLGLALGANLSGILQFLADYSRIAWMAVGLLLVLALAAFLVRRPG